MCDVILSNPRDVWYPYWVWRMNKDRHLFDKVIVMITQTATDRDYVQDLKNLNVTVIEDYVDDGTDWRNAAINRALKESKSDKILFLEQDFLYKNGFIEGLLEIDGYDAIGFRDGNRFHPACLLVTREATWLTQRDFSVDPDVGDHFFKFTTELEAMNNWADLKTFELPEWHHLAGLTQNYRLESNWYHPPSFYTYNKMIQKLLMPDSWLEVCKATEKKMGDITLDPKVSEFFNEA